MFRVFILLLLSTSPALAWEARSGIICELAYEGEQGSISVTYDPAIQEYSIAIAPEQPWSPGSVFVMRFEGAQADTITTDRHELSADGSTLTVTDRGFGNVLNGLEFNTTATVLLAYRAISVPLAGAGPAVRDFRTCATSLAV